MLKVKKKQILIRAYELGNDDEKIKEWFDREMIINRGDTYEVFSLESGKQKGQIAEKGFFVKVDIEGNIYPSSKEKLLEDYKYVGENQFLPREKEFSVWFSDEPLCEEIQFLVEYKGLKINAEDEDAYFSVPLWGTIIRAAKDAALMLYSVERDERNKILNIDFNFVERQIFEKTYIRV